MSFARILSAFASVVSLTATLAGCNERPELRVDHASLSVDDTPARIDEVHANGTELITADQGSLGKLVSLFVFTSNDVQNVVLTAQIPREVGKYTCGSAKTLDVDFVWPEEPVKAGAPRSVYAVRATGEAFSGTPEPPIGSCEIEIQSIETIERGRYDDYRVRGTLKATAARAVQDDKGFVTAAEATSDGKTKSVVGTFDVIVSD